EWVDAQASEVRRKETQARAAEVQAAEKKARLESERESMRAEGRELSIVSSVLVLGGGLAALGYGSLVGWSGDAEGAHRAPLALGLMFTGLGFYLWRRRRFTPRMSNRAWQSGGL